MKPLQFLVVLTTTDDPADIRRCYEPGCSMCITKSTEDGEFAAALQKLAPFLSVVSLPAAHS